MTNNLTNSEEQGKQLFRSMDNTFCECGHASTSHELLSTNQPGFTCGAIGKCLTADCTCNSYRKAKEQPAQGDKGQPPLNVCPRKPRISAVGDCGTYDTEESGHTCCYLNGHPSTHHRCYCGYEWEPAAPLLEPAPPAKTFEELKKLQGQVITAVVQIGRQIVLMTANNSVFLNAAPLEPVPALNHSLQYYSCCGQLGQHAKDCDATRPAAEPAKAEREELIKQMKALCKLPPGPTSVAEGWFPKIADFIQQSESRLRGILAEQLDREVTDESLETLAILAANGLYWRNEEIKKLESQLTAAQKECVATQAALELCRSKLASGVLAVQEAVRSRDWLTEGRGPYEWNDDNWHKEFGFAAEEILKALEPLVSEMRSFEHCPKTSEAIAAARANLHADLTAANERIRELGNKLQILTIRYETEEDGV